MLKSKLIHTNHAVVTVLQNLLGDFNTLVTCSQDILVDMGVANRLEVLTIEPRFAHRWVPAKQYDLLGFRVRDNRN